MIVIPSQIIQNINIKDLVLWTENPRDPLSPDSGSLGNVSEQRRNPGGTLA